MASRAASHVLSRWRHRDASDAASSLGGHRANVPRPPLRHRRDTSQIPSAARPPPSPSTFLKPHETASPSRAHPPASARGQTIRALPWEDAAARFLQLGFEVARRPASCTRAFPYSPTVARFDPRQAGHPESRVSPMACSQTQLQKKVVNRLLVSPVRMPRTRTSARGRRVSTTSARYYNTSARL